MSRRTERSRRGAWSDSSRRRRKDRLTTPRRAAWLLVLGLAGAAVIGCSEEDRDEVAQQAEDAATEAADKAEDAAGAAAAKAQDVGARAQAEALRAAINGQDLAQGETVRSVAVLQEAADGLPANPTVEGIADTNGDGFDDDGRVEVRVEQERSCLTLPASGDNIDIGDC